jgi:hypothetical protein
VGLLVILEMLVLLPAAQASATTVAVELAGSGTGTVTGTPPGIECSNTSGSQSGACSVEPEGFGTVELDAIPGPGSVFMGWSGNGGTFGENTCNAGNENPCHIDFASFDGGTYTASFESSGPRQDLKVALSGSGAGEATSSPAGIQCGATCEHEFAEGSTVLLSASPNGSSTFTGWRGCDTVTAGKECKVVMSEAKSVIAEFGAIPQHSLDVSKSGSGAGEVASSPAGIECGSVCTAQFNEGATVLLIATPDPPTVGSRSIFVGWTGCDSLPTENECEVTMTESKSIEARFEARPQRTLTVDLAGGGSGEVTSSPGGISCGSTCQAEFEEGSVVALTAAPAVASVFTGWSGGGCSGIGVCDVTLASAATVSAQFQPLPAPTAETGTANSITQTTATVTGMIDGQGADTTWLFDYGPTTSYGQRTPNTGSNAGVVSNDTDESIELRSLEPNTTYHYQLIAFNVGVCLFTCPPTGPNTTFGEDKGFTTLPLPPGVQTDVPTSVGTAGAMVTGEVVPQGATTQYRVQYGTTEALGSSTQSEEAGSGAAGVYLTSTLEGLQADTTYYYRFNASNAGGEQDGALESFTTASLGEPSTNEISPGFSLTGGNLGNPSPIGFPELNTLTPEPIVRVIAKAVTGKQATRAQRLAKALQACGREKPKARRERCDTRARSRYGPHQST